jgi:TonB family protein
MKSLRFEPRLVDPGLDRHLPEPARLHAERQEMAPLPAAERQPRREPTPSRSASVALPKSNPAAQIKGPAAERRVLFQPPLPKPTVESETEIELRFWILPNGTVGRVVPLKKANPRLEALAINYLRNWRFDPLPPDAAPEEQWGVIPFKFRIR